MFSVPTHIFSKPFPFSWTTATCVFSPASLLEWCSQTSLAFASVQREPKGPRNLRCHQWLLGKILSSLVPDGDILEVWLISLQRSPAGLNQVTTLGSLLDTSLLPGFLPFPVTWHNFLWFFLGTFFNKSLLYESSSQALQLGTPTLDTAYPLELPGKLLIEILHLGHEWEKQKLQN